MKLRQVQRAEQPERLHSGLRDARIVSELPEHPTSDPEQVVGVGVPHGVANLRVTARNVEVRRDHGMPRIYWCRTHGYRALEPTTGDGSAYPPEECTRIGYNKVPDDGFYDVLMSVSVNGNVDARIERFYPHVATVANLESASA